MTSVLLLLLLLTRAEGPDAPAQAPAPPSAARWHSLVRGETSMALLPRGGTGRREGFLRVAPTLGSETLRPRAFASLSLGVDHAR